jgi:hypothetical protein
MAGSVPPLTGVGPIAKAGPPRSKERRIMATKHFGVLFNVDILLDLQYRSPYCLFEFLRFFTFSEHSRLLKKSFFPGCSKRASCQAPEILRSEAYSDVRCNDEG